MLYPATELPDDTPVEYVRFATRIRNALNAAGMKTIVRPITKRQALGKAEIEERPMTKPGLFRRLDAGIDRRSCHATIVAIRPPGGCTSSVLGLGAAVPRSCFLQERFPVSCLN
jgi:hypothetical protein